MHLTIHCFVALSIVIRTTVSVQSVYSYELPLFPFFFVKGAGVLDGSNCQLFADPECKDRPSEEMDPKVWTTVSSGKIAGVKPGYRSM